MKVTDGAAGLIAKSLEQSQKAASDIASGAGNAGLAEDFVNLSKAEKLTKTAVKTIQAADETTKNIIDLLA